jgi:hypothetical protein
MRALFGHGDFLLVSICLQQIVLQKNNKELIKIKVHFLDSSKHKFTTIFVF